MTRSIIKYINDMFVANAGQGPCCIVIKCGSIPTLLVRETINDYHKYAKQ